MPGITQNRNNGYMKNEGNEHDDGKWQVDRVPVVENLSDLPQCNRFLHERGTLARNRVEVRRPLGLEETL